MQTFGVGQAEPSANSRGRPETVNLETTQEVVIFPAPKEERFACIKLYYPAGTCVRARFAYRAINPKSRAPAVDTDDRVLTETRGILA